MSLKEALLKHKQQLDEITQASLKKKQEFLEQQQTEKLEMMLAQQQRILDRCDIVEKPHVKTKKERVDYSFNPNVLDNGGITFYHTTINGVKRKFRISVTSDTNDVVLKFHTRISSGERFSVNAKSYSEASKIIGEIFGFGMYVVSASII